MEKETIEESQELKEEGAAPTTQASPFVQMRPTDDALNLCDAPAYRAPFGRSSPTNCFLIAPDRSGRFSFKLFRVKFPFEDNIFSALPPRLHPLFELLPIFGANSIFLI